MPSLGRLVRGLSALFWGLPAALLVCVHTAMARTDPLKALTIVPPLACTSLLVYGCAQLAAFQKQERVWRKALDYATVIGIVNVGLSPFVYWWNKVPGHPFFTVMVFLLQLAGLLFLACLNIVLRRLGAMLPDEALRLDIKQFTLLNFNLLTVIGFLGAASVFFTRSPELPLSLQVQKLPHYLQPVAGLLERGTLWLPLLLLLLPLAMTMALLWKTKEVILDNVFGPKPPA
jgi:hypothetical protein